MLWLGVLLRSFEDGGVGSHDVLLGGISERKEVNDALASSDRNVESGKGSTLDQRSAVSTPFHCIKRAGLNAFSNFIQAQARVAPALMNRSSSRIRSVFTVPVHLSSLLSLPPLPVPFAARLRNNGRDVVSARRKNDMQSLPRADQAASMGQFDVTAFPERLTEIPIISLLHISNPAKEKQGPKDRHSYK